jgi:hypothetical protein
MAWGVTEIAKALKIGRALPTLPPEQGAGTLSPSKSDIARAYGVAHSVGPQSSRRHRQGSPTSSLGVSVKGQANALLDRGHGKPTKAKAIEAGVNPTSTHRSTFARRPLDEAELAARAGRRGARLVDPRGALFLGEADASGGIPRTLFPKIRNPEVTRCAPFIFRRLPGICDQKTPSRIGAAGRAGDAG